MEGEGSFQAGPHLDQPILIHPLPLLSGPQHPVSLISEQPRPYLLLSRPLGSALMVIRPINVFPLITKERSPPGRIS